MRPDIAQRLAPVAGLVAVAAAGALLELGIDAGVVDEYTVPRSSAVLASLPRLFAEEHVARRFLITAGGMLGAGLLALATGLAFGIVLFPVLILRCGVGPGSKVAMGAVSCFFPVVLAVVAGVRGVASMLLRVGRSCRASRRATVTKIVLPAMAAPLVTGIRLGFGVALIGVLLGETKLSNQGVGFLIMQSFQRFDMPGMYGLLLVTVAFAALVNVGTERVAAHLAGRERVRR